MKAHSRTDNSLSSPLGVLPSYNDFACPVITSVYAFFAPEIGKLFFPKGNNSLRAVKTFSVFAGG